MRNTVRVLPEDEWETWVADQADGGQAPEEGEDATAAGREIFTSTGCGSCHTFSDAGTTSAVGPNLDELADVAADRKPRLDAEGYVEEAIVDPPAFVVDGFDGNIMPATYKDQLTPEEIDTLVQYLLGMTGGGK
jgi:mono/diheme cytochrome c family protein